MIKINLISQNKKTFNVSTSTVDLSCINKKMLLLGVLLLLLSEYVGPMVWQWRINDANSEIEVLNRQLASIKEKSKENKDIEKSLEEYQKQIPELEKISSTVENLTSTITNPKKILEMIAKNIPDGLWFKRLEINHDNKIYIEGLSNSYKTVGDFIGNINNTPFFNQSLNLAETKTLTHQNGSQIIRLESFTLEGLIKTYDPFQE